MQTIKIKYIINDNDKLLLNDYIKQYNHVYRVAFNNYHFEYYMRYSEYTKDEKDKLDAMIFEL